MAVDHDSGAGERWFARFPVPAADGHKHDRGHALVLSGRRHATGAARLAAGAALRAGAGLVTLAASRSAADIVATHATAVMVRVADGLEEWSALLHEVGPAALCVGPGLAPNAETRAMVLPSLRSRAAVVLDAGALTAHANEPDALFGAIEARDAPTVLTPHGGEFARLFGEATPADAARQSGATVLLKGPTTRIAAPSGSVRLSRHGPPWLATAGTGDVLAGLVTGLLAQGMPAPDAAEAGAWLHGEAARRLGFGMTANDLDHALRAVIGDVLRARTA